VMTPKRLKSAVRAAGEALLVTTALPPPCSAADTATTATSTAAATPPPSSVSRLNAERPDPGAEAGGGSGGGGIGVQAAAEAPGRAHPGAYRSLIVNPDPGRKRPTLPNRFPPSPAIKRPWRIPT